MSDFCWKIRSVYTSLRQVYYPKQRLDYSWTVKYIPNSTLWAKTMGTRKNYNRGNYYNCNNFWRFCPKKKLNITSMGAHIWAEIFFVIVFVFLPLYEHSKIIIFFRKLSFFWKKWIIERNLGEIIFEWSYMGRKQKTTKHR